MALNNPNPIVIPQTVEKTFPHLWLYNIFVNAHAIDKGEVTIITLPYNKDTQELASSEYADSITGDLWKAVAEVPEVAIAMNAIFNAVEPLRVWAQQQNADQ
jgi:hypothetical protein